MTVSLNETRRLITKILRPSGFKREGATWRRRLAEVTQVLSLQKSKWGSQYYVNVGILIRALDDISRPKPQQCHLLGRPAMILGKGNPEDFVIDLEKGVQNNNVETVEDIRDAFFSECVSLAGIRRFLRKKTGVLVTGEAKHFLRHTSAKG
jgi:hypothetical protein